MNNEFILILDDETDKGGKLEQAIVDAGYSCELANTLEKAQEILDNKKVTFCVFDVWLKNVHPDLTSIDFARSISPKLPTLFITQFSDNPDNKYFQRIIEELPHSTYVSRRAINWTDDVIKGITLAKEKFRLFQFKENSEIINQIPIQNKLTFNEWHGGRRVFLEKDKILFVTSHRNRMQLHNQELGLNKNLKNEQKEEFNKALKRPGDYCVFYTTDGEFIPFGTRLGNIEEQLEKYRGIGWQFHRVHNQYLVNLELVEEFVNGEYLKLQGCDYLIPTTSFHDGDASFFFPFLRA